MHVIRTVNTKRFSLNGIEYLKNYVTHVSGNLLEIFNCYDRCDTLLPPTHYNQFAVNGAVYTSVAQLQAALADVLYVRTTLGEVAADISQDNVDLVRKHRISTYSMSTVLSAINTGTAFSISDTQSVWFVFTTTIGNSSVPRGTVYKYKMMGLGKGDYGSANGANSPVALTSANLELVYYNEPTANAFLLDPTTHVINLGIAIQGATISSLLNARPASAPINIQPAEEGFTVFEATVGSIFTQRLWTGGSGKYGQGAQQATEDDLEELPDGVNGSTTPDYDTVLKKGNETEEYAIHKDVGQQGKTAFGTNIVHSGENGICTLQFEEPVADVTLTIPATNENDTLVTMSYINKPVKFIYDYDPLLINNVYILQPEDYKYWLSFECSENFTVKIQPSLIPDNALVEGNVSGTGMAAFTVASPLNLITASGELPETEEQNSVFGLKFGFKDRVLLFGKLKPV